MSLLYALQIVAFMMANNGFVLLGDSLFAERGQEQYVAALMCIAMSSIIFYVTAPR